TGNDFGLAPFGRISGFVFSDVDNDGEFDVSPITGLPTEPGRIDQRVYIDLNNNGSLDANEPSVLTAANGRYEFPGLPNGTYAIRVDLPPSLRQTTPADAHVIDLTAGQNVIRRDFGIVRAASVSGR